MRGKPIRLSPARRLVGDLMSFSLTVPRVSVQRRMNIRSLVEARRRMEPRASWTSIFVKGYSVLAQETPEFRRAYVKLPWPHLYQYPLSVASIAYEREHEGEHAVLLGRIKAPELLSIAELNHHLATMANSPVTEIKDFRRALQIARLPMPLRRLMMWLGLNIGRQRPNYFGTFQFSVYAGLGADSFNPLTPLTTLLNYGPLGEDGCLNVRILYDHRVMDGASVARALVRFEEILNGDILHELAS
jgi:hypothetical protein